MAMVGFLAAQALFSFALITFIRFISGTISQPLTIAFTFVLFEWIVGHLPVISFSWLTFSTTAINTPIRIFARAGGGALLSFILVLLSGFIVEIIQNQQIAVSKNSFTKIAIMIVIFGMLLVVSNMNFGDKSTTKTIAVVQGNDKNRYLTSEEIQSSYIQNSHLKLAKAIKGKTDLLIFPESSFTQDPESNIKTKKQIAEIANKANDIVLMNTIAENGDKQYNRNFFYSPNMRLLGTYDKKRLVPFGEYVPADSLIGNLSIFDPIGIGFTPGTKDITVKYVTSLICYESAFSQDVRSALTGNSKLLVITTNNRSYRRSGNSLQHRTLTQLRSLEFGISSVHASISGSSALIDDRGNIVDSTELFEKTVLKGRLSVSKPNSFYAKTFDWFSLLALVVVGYLFISALRKGRWVSQIVKR